MLTAPPLQIGPARVKYAKRLGGLTAASLAIALPGIVHGQAIERHEPPHRDATSAPIVSPNAVPNEEDDTPIGPELKSLVIIGKGQPLRTPVTDGVDVSSVDRLSAVAEAISADLNPFLGRKISRKLIAEIEAAIARRYRRLGFAFISMSTPEQKISDGSLHVRVLEYAVGLVTTRGVPPADAPHVLEQIGIKSGEPIDTVKLGNDLAWMNRYPYRSTVAVFTPGRMPGDTDLILSAQTSKPWQVYAGYDNSGSPSTTFDRYFFGAAIGSALGRDSVVSFQATASRDALGGNAHPKYSSAALSYTLPVLHNAQIETGFDHIDTNQPSGDFTSRLKTDEGSFGIRFAAPFALDPSTQSDLRLGLSLKHQVSVTLFGDQSIAKKSVENHVFYTGYHVRQQIDRGYMVADLALHFSFGSMDGAANDTQERAFSEGRVTGARYAFTTFSLERSQLLTSAATWKFQIFGQLSPQALPSTEQSGLGGENLLRGYTLDAGSYDSSVIVRNEIHLGPSPGWAVNISPFAFIDAGGGRDEHLKISTKISSIGIGADQILMNGAILHFTAARLMESAKLARAGDWKAQVSLAYSY